jgi:hypothetical protein
MKIIRYSSICLVVILLAVLLFKDMFAQLPFVFKDPIKLYFSSEVDKKLDAKWSKILKLEKEIEDLDLFKVTRFKNGAEHFTKNFKISQNKISIEIDESLKLKLKDNSYKINWADHNAPLEVFNGIREFDHLNFEVIPELKGNLNKLDLFDIIHSNKLPLFKISEISRLRLLKGVDENDLENAIIEVRHLAKLISTLDNAVLTLTALVILKNENSFRDKNRDLFKNIKIERISQDKLSDASEFFQNIRSISDIRLSDEWFKKTTELKVGSCYGLNFASGIALLGKQYFEKIIPNNYNRLKLALIEKKNICANSTKINFIIQDKSFALDNKRLLKFAGLTDKFLDSFFYNEKTLSRNKMLKESVFFANIVHLE